MKMKFALAVIAFFTAIAYADMVAIGPTPSDFVLALIISIAVEFAVAFIYLHDKKLPKKILISVVIANIVSIPLLFLLLYFSGLALYSNFYGLIFLGEIGVVALEAAIIYLMNRKKIRKGQAVELSVINNVASFIAGLIVTIILISLHPTPLPYIPVQCIFPIDFSCRDYYINGSGNFTLFLMQNTGHPIIITGFNCTSADNPNGIVSSLPRPVFIKEGSEALVVNGTPCYRQNVDVATGKSGDYYNGKIYVAYNETDTGFSHEIAGSIRAEYVSPPS
jgi:hypothetical protein